MPAKKPATSTPTAKPVVTAKPTVSHIHASLAFPFPNRSSQAGKPSAAPAVPTTGAKPSAGTTQTKRGAAGKEKK